MTVSGRPPSIKPSRDSISRAGIVSWSLLGIFLLAGLAIYVLGFLRVVFPPIALALVLIFLLNPFVSRLERRGVRRGVGTAVIYVALLIAGLLVLSWLVPPLAKQVEGLLQRGPELQQQAIESTQNLADRLNISLDAIGLGGLSAGEAGEPATGEENSRSLFRSLTPGFFAGAGRFATGALHTVLNFILGPVFAAYLLIDLPRIQELGRQYMPPRYRDEWIPLLDRIGQTVGSFFRGQLLVASIVGVMSCLMFLIIDLPFWLPIGLLAGFFNIIPLVGPFVGGGVAAIVGGMTGGVSLAVKAVVAMVVVQQIDNHFISPKVMGWAVRLHPVVIMLSLILGASLGGIWGMLLAVPGAAVAKIIFVHFYQTRVLGDWDYRTGDTKPGGSEKPSNGKEPRDGPDPKPSKKSVKSRRLTA